MTLPIPAAQHLEKTPEMEAFFSQANFLVAKLTDYCNLRCKYCHQDALNGHAVLMPIETFKNAVRLVLRHSKAPAVYVQFHGGEPLLQPDSFFYEAVQFCKEELEHENRKVIFYIQTNLTKVTPEREAMLRALNIHVSYSLDGPPEINDQMRGGGRMIVKNARRMKEHGMDLGAICLIHSANWDRMDEVVGFFQKEGIRSVRFNMMVPDGRGKDLDSSTAEKLWQARTVVLDHMLSFGEEACIDAVLYNQMRRFVKPIGAPSSQEYHGCESLYCQAGRSLYSLNPDGSFYACDRIAENPHWAMGNVNQLFAEEQKKAAQKKRSAFHHKDEWWSRCDTCDAKKICEFSCSAYYVDAVDTREVECQQTKKMWETFVKRKDEIIDFMEKRTPPLALQERMPLRQQSEDTWAVRDIAMDQFYSQLTSQETLAANEDFRLVRRGTQFFLYVTARQKIFEVDELVAEIARFNGVLSPSMIEKILGDNYPAGKLQESLARMQTVVPEVFRGSARALHAGAAYHEA